eukprot:CAMPEP_0202971210 /NCGR_PEP_ID=MMETSP1396-20130829/24848_1 /ASSEMBLY_ACC=CAM_ASM_000872 /TAXON_ID= /ORGANISM="Pseudokeronopsis sp., Strain Brazil" /LENGTH=52 /DNA_ID=CAMNT_0049700381 /DNA_START=551 /DNA_END=709 /DNA_ORIENTATION=+
MKDSKSNEVFKYEALKSLKEKDQKKKKMNAMLELILQETPNNSELPVDDTNS